jgi:hypothetical protein
MYNDERMKFDAKIMSSCHINFLFGAGVNGSAFKQMKDFKTTIQLLESNKGRKMSNFETDVNMLAEDGYDTVMQSFRSEYERFEKDIDYEHEAIGDIKQMFYLIHKLMLESENRTITTKQVNIYTLNYDNIVEGVLDQLGLLYNTVSSHNVDNHDKFFDMIGYNYNRKRYVPTYLVSKVHGDISNPILPGRKKFDEVLATKAFELLFNMKTKLLRMNSVLIVIGYSGKDNHINTILQDCVSAGLTIYWFRYNKKESVPHVLNEKITVIDQQTKYSKQNTTKLCRQMLEEIWDKSSGE